jgi:hypothetical protein
MDGKRSMRQRTVQRHRGRKSCNLRHSNRDDPESFLADTAGSK